MDRLHKLSSLLFTMKNSYIYFCVRWSIKSKGKVYFKTKPDRLYIEINQTDIKERGVTECLYALSKLLCNKIINSYSKEKNELGICAFNKKTVLKFDIFHIGNIVYLALSAGFFIEEYDNDFFLVTVKDKLKFMIRKEIRSDILILRNAFVYEEYGKYMPDIQGKIILDIGGFIGDTAIYFSHLGASIVYVYEPHPVLYQIMIKNIELNNIKNIITKDFGVSDENSIISVKENKSFSGPTSGFGLKVPKEREGKTVEIKVVSLREIIEDIGEIDFLKMDCEGYELQSLLSCKRIHLEKIKKMVVECHGNTEKIVTHLKRNGFFVKVERQFLIASLL